MAEASKSGYQTGIDYPHVRPEFFTSHSLVSIDTGEIRQDGFDGLKLHSDRTSLVLPGTDIILPGHKLTLGNDFASYEDRFAIIGIGSNCSPDILLQKFQSKSIGGDFIIAQSTLSHHAVCHGAFVGGKGTVPATVMPHQGSHAHITVGFFTADQAAALTDTEPNYDLVAIKSPLKISLTDERNIIPEDAMLYVSIWGGLTSSPESTQPMALTAIPQDTLLEKFTSEQAMDKVARLNGYKSTEAFFNYVANGMPLKERLQHNWNIANTSGLSATIEGRQIKGSTIGKNCQEFQLPVPQIAYS